MDAAWADDFHHAVHAYLTGERNGYYQDFGASRRIALALEDGWSYNWEYSASRERHHGTSPAGLPTTSFVFCTQNHDQVGNRMLGERLPTLAGREAEQAARVLLLLAPYIPLLFMGQEYGEQRPFLYIIDHSDPGLVRATREGRKREFAAFHREGEPPDPADSATAGRSVLDWDSRTEGEHNDDLELSRALLSLRGEYDCFRPSLAGGESGTRRRAFADGGLIGFKTEAAMYGGVVVVNLSGTPAGLASRELCTALGLPSLPRAALPGSEIFRHGEVSLLKEGTERERIELGPFSAWASVYKAHSAGSIGRTPSVS
jgi:malto-oligosyltrehalose trehalohydrolase